MVGGDPSRVAPHGPPAPHMIAQWENIEFRGFIKNPNFCPSPIKVVFDLIDNAAGQGNTMVCYLMAVAGSRIFGRGHRSHDPALTTAKRTIQGLSMHIGAVTVAEEFANIERDERGD